MIKFFFFFIKKKGRGGGGFTDSSLNRKAIFEKELHSKAFEWPVCPTSWQIAENNNEYYYNYVKYFGKVVNYNIE